MMGYSRLQLAVKSGTLEGIKDETEKKPIFFKISLHVFWLAFRLQNDFYSVFVPAWKSFNFEDKVFWYI